jgi:hypothetical protein
MIQMLSFLAPDGYILVNYSYTTIQMLIPLAKDGQILICLVENNPILSTIFDSLVKLDSTFVSLCIILFDMVTSYKTVTT